ALLFRHNPIFEEEALHPENRIFLHRLLKSNFGSIEARIGDRVTAEPLRHRFDQNRPRCAKALMQRLFKTGVAMEKIESIESIRLNPIGMSKMFGDRLDANRPGGSCSHPPLVVLDDA